MLHGRAESPPPRQSFTAQPTVRFSRASGGGRSQSVFRTGFRAKFSPNKGLQATPSSLRSYVAPASGRA
jgi:hypothetical protein